MRPSARLGVARPRRGAALRRAMPHPFGLHRRPRSSEVPCPPLGSQVPAASFPLAPRDPLPPFFSPGRCPPLVPGPCCVSKSPPRVLCYTFPLPHTRRDFRVPGREKGRNRPHRGAGSCSGRGDREAGPARRAAGGARPLARRGPRSGGRGGPAASRLLSRSGERASGRSSCTLCWFRALLRFKL